MTEKNNSNEENLYSSLFDDEFPSEEINDSDFPPIEEETKPVETKKPPKAKASKTNEMENIIDASRHMINLGKENFSKFLSVITVLSKLCQDLILKDGKISQMSDRKTSICSIDLSNILGKSSILLSRLASKSEMLLPFKNQQVDVNLVIDEPTQGDHLYTFEDNFSKLSFNKPLEKYLSNEFLTETQVEEKLNLDDMGPIFQCEFGKSIVERMAAFSKGLETNKIKVVFEGDSAKFRLASENDVSSSTLLSVDNLTQTIVGSCEFPITPFLLTGKIDISCFLRKNDSKSKNTSLFLKLTSDVETIPMTIWVISVLI